eukprot:gene32330-41892_t
MSGDFNTVLYSPPEYIIDVISSQESKINGGTRWTISDVSVKSGKDLNTARRDLLNLATATGAVLEVTDDGEVLYSFPANWKRLLQQRSIARQFKTKVNEVSPLLWAAFRGTFGTALVASLVFLAVAILVVQNTCYSYLFGDDDPNLDFDVKLDKLIAAVIVSNNGVVVAEQLAPFLRDPPVYKVAADDANVRESWVLPVVLKFDGKPVVTENGNIVYQFEELLKTAGNQSPGKPVPLREGDVLETKIAFSKAETSQLYLAAGLGGLNLLGAVVLGSMSRSATSTASTILLSRAYPFVLCYAILFNLIPLGRFLTLTAENVRIDRRNSSRMKWFSLSSSSSSELDEKLADKKPLELAAQRIDQAKVIYSTADDGDDRGGDGGGSKLSWVWSKVARLGRRLRPRW